MKQAFKLAFWLAFIVPFLSRHISAQPSNGLSGEGRNLLVAAGLSGVRILSQNWSDAEARRFYDTTQGSQMMPYAWFLHLEQESSTNLFRDAANMRALGYLPRARDAASNPDGLPVGFTRNEASVGLTCAACHTAQINYQGTAWLIDGGPTMADAQKMMGQLVASLRATLGNPEKLARFSRAVLGADAGNAEKQALRQDLLKVIDQKAAYHARNFPAAGKPAFGPGRLDAFDAIYNEVAVRFAQVSNAATQCDAPVSYPFLWDTPHHDRVQWNGTAPNTVVAGLHVGALGRNIGEVLGVFAEVDPTRRELPLGGYPSSVRTDNLKDLEDLLRQLWSPQWPEAFGKIDAVLAAKGAVLFQQNCARCHQSIQRTDPQRKVKAQMSVVETDESMARNAYQRESASGIFEGRLLLLPPFRPLRKTERISTLLSHLGQRVLVGSRLIEDKETVPFAYDTFAEVGEGEAKVSVMLSSVEIDDDGLAAARVKSLALLKSGEPPDNLSQARIASIPNGVAAKFTLKTNEAMESFMVFRPARGVKVPVSFDYKARPLNGIWATAPYLHNGSVLNLDELLKPAKDRKTVFHVGTREFDPKNVGYVDAGDFLFDTKAQPGNSNAGHEYGGKVFTPDERAQLVEYMKSL